MTLEAKACGPGKLLAVTARYVTVHLKNQTAGRHIMISWTELPDYVKTWRTFLILVGAVIGWLASQWWTLRTHSDEIAAGRETRRIEVQKPFLQRRLDVYFSTIEAARRLTDSNLNPDLPEWKENATRVWELRWGELEMVGDKGTRDAARRVTYKMDTVRENPTDSGARKELRWAVECLADELRLSLEKSWGFDPSAVRQTALGRDVSTLPSGCTDSGLPPSVPPGMSEITQKPGAVDPAPGESKK
jgi:hypothetical protein